MLFTKILDTFWSGDVDIFWPENIDTISSKKSDKKNL